MSNNHRASDKRIVVIQALIFFWVMAIGAKLVRLQINEHDSLRARAERQQQAVIELSPMRGIIYDRNGNELARSVEVKSLYASPAEISDPDSVADQLSELLGIDRDALFKRLTSSQVFVAVKRKLTEKEAAAVTALNLPGLRFVDEMKRHYVSGPVASHILGYVNIDEYGQSGIERAYDEVIRGQGGRLMLDIDALKKSYGHSVEQSVPGANVTLTIDVLIQSYAERALADAVKSLNARGGTVVVMRPATGEILAMANYPTFDPNDLSGSDDEDRRNRAIETAFEPGSIFKLVTYSAALEERIIKPNTMIDCSGGEIRIADRIVHDKPYGQLTAAQALAKSSNVAAIKLGLRLGEKKLARYIEEFGFGRRTGIELPAESRGLLQPVSEWQPTTMGSIPMGHEIGVTAVQAVAAYAAIANGGEWVKPYIVSRVTSASGEVIQEHTSEQHRVVSEYTAATLKEMLEGVVVKGTGKAAQISGYRAAGKTGTAQKVDEKTHRYSNTKYVASFAGFAPVDNPEIACIVSIDEPRLGEHHGGDAAAPVFARVVADTLHALGVPPENDPQSTTVASDSHVYDMPEVVIENDSAIRAQAIQPAIADTPAYEAASKPGSIVVPDFTGLSIREAASLCAARGLKIRTTGDGVITSQSPPPGTLVAQDAICSVRLSRQVVNSETQKPGAKKETAQQKPVAKSRSASGTARGAGARAN
ncbi:MAG TPA: penicillin-binding protein [Blastocatellia bacterium]|nr:penicillin-binding protein [Blastocatellia bacterium]